MTTRTISLFLCGDVMLARGIDMIQKQHCEPVLYEGNGLDAHDYVELAVKKNGSLPKKQDRDFSYIWGDAIQELEEKMPDVRIINLETSITTSDTPWPKKGIHYRMHPTNIGIIQAAKIDCCVLSNNHTADWGYDGLKETLSTLKRSAIAYTGAGMDLKEAERPAVFNLPGKGRVLVFAAGHHSSGIPDEWNAKHGREGLFMINIGHPNDTASRVKDIVSRHRKDGDVVIFSIHWGGNWGYEIDSSFQKFAHTLIRIAEVDLIHGHSSHHAKGLEVYEGKLIIYGCGDFITDYEGITGYEEYRGDLALMYFVDLNYENGNLQRLRMIPTQTKRMRINKAKNQDVNWMHTLMSNECKKLGCDVVKVRSELHLDFQQK